MKIWLDDLRPAPEDWVHVKTAGEAIDLLDNNEVEVISLDNDLGENQPEGHTVASYLEERVALLFIPAPEIQIHTANPVAMKRMEQTVESIKRFNTVLQHCREHGMNDE